MKLEPVVSLLAAALAAAACVGDLDVPPIDDTSQALKDISFVEAKPEDCMAEGKNLDPKIAASQQFWIAPDELRRDLSKSHGRLIDPLRHAAQTHDAREILLRSVGEHIRVARGTPGASPALAQAYADLSVTGRAAYTHFRTWHPSNAKLISAALTVRAAGAFEPADATDVEIVLAVGKALDRAYRVAWAIRGPTEIRVGTRADLGWIAVSSEDDSPHRPVNVPSAMYPQYDIALTVQGELGPLPVTLRYVLASEAEWLDRGPMVESRALPPDGHGYIPTGDDVVIYIPGHGSRAEEAMHMAPHMMAEARARGRSLTVLSIDLPSAGYASRIEHTLVAPSERSQHNVAYPTLDFLEETIVELVAELDRRQPGVSAQIVGVVGGSLGGNMGLRLARRDPAKYPWLRNVAAWSPASVWESFAPASWGDVDDGDTTYYNPIKAEVVRVTRDRMNADESDAEYQFPEWHESRQWFFDNVYGPPIVGQRPVSERWWRDGWECKADFIVGSMLSMDEVYGPTQRRWHWRVAHEQVIFSHLDPDPGGTESRFLTMKARVLLAAGAGDNFDPEYLYDRAVRIGRDMPDNGGRAIFLTNSGHSIHDEYPAFWGQYVMSFLMEAPQYDPPPLLPSVMAAIE